MADYKGKRGDGVNVKWIDIHTDPTGDPNKPKLYLWRRQPGIFWGYEDIEVEGTIIPCLILTVAEGEAGDETQNGYTCIPNYLVLKVTKKR